MRAYAVVPKETVEYHAVEDDLASGLEEAPLINFAKDAVHLDVSLARLQPGGRVGGHLHPYEESFYVVEGEVLFEVADRSYLLGPDCFGFAPVGTTHSWRNTSDEPVRWLRTRSPIPRSIAQGTGVHPVPNRPPPETGDPVRADDVTRRFVGRFHESLLNEPGSLQMRGFRSPEPTNVSIWMMVDEAIGAVHHTKFSVRFDPTDAGMTLGGQHFHPFEETYYITSGRAVAHLEDESFEVGPGDTVFAGVGALHGFTNPGNDPVRWIEMQAPNPPPSNAFFFANDWSSR
ncbi:MAG: cupin domain-containing protein [Acidimicrobiia bacterium]|nr:cupin domain-containing protein [Acidimicrobiia bacterium]